MECKDKRCQGLLDAFVRSVPSDGRRTGLQMFIDAYFEQLLTFGTAVGEMLSAGDGVDYLYSVPLSQASIRRSPKDFRKTEVCRSDGGAPVPRQELILLSALNPDAGKLYGNSVLKGLPFVSSVLLKIYNAVGANWERVGNVRFAVTYKPKDDAMGKAFAKERAMQIAHEWGEAMKSSSVRDFIAVGDVDIKVIGADNQILDSNVPARQMLEQIVAKLSLPPFMLGLSWSTTERMSAQQADLLTTEIEAYRRQLTPVIEKICKTHLRLHGFSSDVAVLWDDITLQDEVEHARALLYNAQTEKILREIGGKHE